MVIFLFHLQLTALIHNNGISKHFTKPAEYIRTSSGTIFSAEFVDKLRSGDFSIQISLLIKRPAYRCYPELCKCGIFPS